MILRTNVAAARAALFVAGLVASLLAPVHAAVVTWGSATQISGDSDVSTAGTLVGAFNVGGSATTVNGVSFQGFGVGTGAGPPATYSVGNYTLAATCCDVYANATSGTTSPYASLSSVYQAMLGTAGTPISDMTLTLGGLTPGTSYLFQAWSNDSRASNFHYGATLSAGNDVTLDSNTGTGNPDPLNDGYLGQFVIGTFTADATSLDILFKIDEVTTLNGFQLRQVDNGVPEPATLALVALGVAGIGFGRRRRA